MPVMWQNDAVVSSRHEAAKVMKVKVVNVVVGALVLWVGGLCLLVAVIWDVDVPDFSIVSSNVWVQRAGLLLALTTAFMIGRGRRSRV